MGAFGRPPEVDSLLREIGPLWQQDIRAAGDRVKAAYLPVLLAAPREGIAVTRQLAYGTQPRQVLDVYRPATAREAPVVVFVHGGAFVRGAKDINDAMYGNVLRWFARQGCVGVNVEYRLAPEAPHPQGALDVAAACAWVAEHIGGFGGDPRRVCLIGHSAGGTHAASFACDPSLAHLRRDLRCLVLVSARLRADALPENPNAAGVRAYYGDDEGRYPALAPMAHAAQLRLPLFVVNAEYENPLLDVYAAEFVHRVAVARGVAPRHMTMAQHNHVSVVAHFDSGEQLLGEQILDFFAAS
jgi:acetyl esterase/lipase